MQFKSGLGWKACFDEEKGRYFGEYGGNQAYHMYELTKEQFDALVNRKMTESEATSVMHNGRHLYMSVDDRCGPPYHIVFDDEYRQLCPWANVYASGEPWPDRLVDMAVELFASEQNNREQRRRKRDARKKQENG